MIVFASSHNHPLAIDEDSRLKGSEDRVVLVEGDPPA